MRRTAVFAILLLFLGALPLLATAQHAGQEQTNASTASAALAAYQEGKQSYDLKDYTTARKKFGEATRLEPENPRWQYNLGLTYRKLNNFQAARQALLRARELDPSYKRAEIDEKLQSMGFDPGSSASSQPPSQNSEKPGEDKFSQPLIVDRPASTLQDKPTEPIPPVSTETAKNDEDDTISLLIGLFCCFGLPIFIIAAIVIVVRRLTRKPSDQAQPKPSAGKFDPQQLAAEESKLADVAIRLTRVEHAMRLGEHPDLRNLLEHATRNEQAAWKALSKVRNGDRAAFGQLQRTASEAAAASQRAVDLATQIYGDQAFIGQGERIGCFFCARPLANPNYRHRLTIKSGTGQDEVITCPDCAAQAERGESPTIRTGDDGHAHWSEIPNYDPYAMRHGEPHLRQVEAWRYEPQQPMSSLSQLATGGALLGAGALAGAGLAAAVSSIFDLDAARQSGLSHEAMGEAARQASGRRGKYTSRDHS